ncbi:Gfo/Idh/MocA family oxidoreductase [Cohnella ginsengisoli]|uniref:Gfo/Idh/MocA family oxidoreductase n=1 Tax=Cohnella ginsengisoli TaxID=425004 RepID=A0A9X4QLY8_9BACL|nr:Gfo/Idh/MocA family oxidoreductase [Cohnella ginsengisoli]MDG0790567.1 Gfo/Idh/MocA family oxidoreductase [Cohnella ginsengisoli]
MILRIGIIGAGAIGQVHAAAFKRLDDAVVAGIADAHLPLAQKAAALLGIERVFDSADQMIASDEIDAVVVGVPNKWHADLAIQALQAGKHVLLEKPMGIHAEAAARIQEAHLKSGKTLMIAHQLRWVWPVRQLKKHMEEGKLGTIYYAKANWLRRKNIPGWGSWFTRMEDSGGGPLIDVGVHLLDLALYLMGNPTPTSVTGSTYSNFGPRKLGIGNWGTHNWNGFFDVEDLATAFVKLDNGATLLFDVSWASHNGNEDGMLLQLMGTEGGATIKLDSGTLHGELFNQKIDIQMTDDEKVDERLLLCKHFVECVREEKEPLPSGKTGYFNNLIIDAIYESSKSGREVRMGS